MKAMLEPRMVAARTHFWDDTLHGEIARPGGVSFSWPGSCIEAISLGWSG